MDNKLPFLLLFLSDFVFVSRLLKLDPEVEDYLKALGKLELVRFLAKVMGESRLLLLQLFFAHLDLFEIVSRSL